MTGFEGWELYNEARQVARLSAVLDYLLSRDLRARDKSSDIRQDTPKAVRVVDTAAAARLWHQQVAASWARCKDINITPSLINHSRTESTGL